LFAFTQFFLVLVLVLVPDNITAREAIFNIQLWQLSLPSMQRHRSQQLIRIITDSFMSCGWEQVGTAMSHFRRRAINSANYYNNNNLRLLELQTYRYNHTVNIQQAFTQDRMVQLRHGPCVIRGSHSYTHEPSIPLSVYSQPQGITGLWLVGYSLRLPRKDDQSELTWVVCYMLG